MDAMKLINGHERGGSFHTVWTGKISRRKNENETRKMRRFLANWGTRAYVKGLLGYFQLTHGSKRSVVEVW